MSAKSEVVAAVVLVHAELPTELLDSDAEVGEVRYVAGSQVILIRVSEHLANQVFVETSEPSRPLCPHDATLLGETCLLVVAAHHNLERHAAYTGECQQCIGAHLLDNGTDFYRYW